MTVIFPTKLVYNSENMCVFSSDWDWLVWHQEDQNRGKANWEHLDEDLHVLITVEDSENRAHVKLQRAMMEVKKLLVPMVRTGIVLILILLEHLQL